MASQAQQHPRQRHDDQRKARKARRKTNLCFAALAAFAFYRQRVSTSVNASSKILTAVSACAFVSTSGGENRTAFSPAPSTSIPRPNAVALTTRSRRRWRAPSSADPARADAPTGRGRGPRQSAGACRPVPSTRPSDGRRPPPRRDEPILSSAIVNRRRARHRLPPNVPVRAGRPRHQAGARRRDASGSPRRSPAIAINHAARSITPSRTSLTAIHCTSSATSRMPCLFVSSRSRCRNSSGATT